MFKIIDAADSFRIKEYNERGDSLRVLETVYKTRQEAELALTKLESEKVGDVSSNPSEVSPAPEITPDAEVSVAPTGEGTPVNDDPAARGAVDEGQAPAPVSAEEGTTNPQA